MTEKLLKADAVAEILDVTKARVYSLTREGQIPFIQVGERQYRYSETAILEWIERGGSQDENENVEN
jgi:excisionase family DNA binding protein